ncbi:MAG: hypothetical protein FJ029_02435 [Actinobacteria bacterium]|nr:hypothetical protein [Actinomycetota bacterium]
MRVFATAPALPSVQERTRQAQRAVEPAEWDAPQRRFDDLGEAVSAPLARHVRLPDAGAPAEQRAGEEAIVVDAQP